MTEMTGGVMKLTAEPAGGLVDGPVTWRVAGVPQAAVTTSPVSGVDTVDHPWTPRVRSSVATDDTLGIDDILEIDGALGIDDTLEIDDTLGIDAAQKIDGAGPGEHAGRPARPDQKVDR